MSEHSCKDCRGTGKVTGYDCKCCDGLGYHGGGVDCLSEDPCPNHWHCDPRVAAHLCTKPDRSKPCPTCGEGEEAW